MVKSKLSHTAYSRGGRGRTVQQGLKSTLDADGHVSFMPSDYAGYSQEEVQDFMSSLPYEVVTIFDPKGNVVEVISQFSDREVDEDESDIAFTIEDSDGDGVGYTHFHNHPDDM